MKAHPLATRFAAAITARDPERLYPLLTEDVRMRALLPAGSTEDLGRDAVRARFDTWFSDNVPELVDALGEDVGRERVVIHYRLFFELAEGPHVMTQTAVCSVHDGLIFRINLLCSGYRRH